ncbi:MAG: DUF456 family protein [Candidatus Andersenbacteria bacterium]|nr:DUF456 family protein [Candidatus Andersenbacteria bacterium]MBI3250718.1 DUF456 family protein [Candidatus Andersenbacteria bacterium]
MSSIILWTVTTVLFIVGLGGTVIPGLPGIGFVFAGILLYAWATSFTTVSGVSVVALGIVALAALAASYLGSAVGAKYGGGKQKAIWGTILGALIGATFGPIGIFVGAFVGGLIGALLEGNSHQQALRIAALSILGTLGASVIQFFLALAMIAAFLVAVFV